MADVVLDANILVAQFVRFVGAEHARLFGDVLDVVVRTGGALNFNDALLVVLQRDGVIDQVATFDEGFSVVPEFRRLG